MKKLLFVSLPKTGSTSVSSWLKTNYENDYHVFKFKKDFNHNFEDKKILDFHTGFQYNKKQNIRMFSRIKSKEQRLQFTVVRDPYERIESGFNYMIKNNYYNDNFVNSKNISFREFVLNRQLLERFMTFEAFNHTFRLLSSYTIENCQILLTTENLSEDWEWFCETCKINYTPIQHKNKTFQNDQPKTVWDEDMKKSIEEYITPDLKLLEKANHFRKQIIK